MPTVFRLFLIRYFRFFGQLTLYWTFLDGFVHFVHSQIEGREGYIDDPYEILAEYFYIEGWLAITCFLVIAFRMRKQF